MFSLDLKTATESLLRSVFGSELQTAGGLTLFFLSVDVCRLPPDISRPTSTVGSLTDVLLLPLISLYILRKVSFG